MYNINALNSTDQCNDTFSELKIKWIVNIVKLKVKGLNDIDICEFIEPVTFCHSSQIDS